MYTNIIKNGGEGIMLKDPMSLYEGKRSNSLLKYKPAFDAEGIIIGHKAGCGKYKGMLGGFIKRSPPFTFAASGINTLRNKFGPAFNMFTSSQNLEQFRDKKKGYGRTMPTIFNNPTVGGIETLGKEVSQIVDEFGNTYRDSIYSKSISEDVFNDIFSEKEAIMQNIKDYIV